MSPSHVRPGVNLPGELGRKLGICRTTWGILALQQPVWECTQAPVFSAFSGVFEPQALKLAIESWAADPQLPGHFGHLAPIMRDGEADRVPLNVLKRSDIALGISQRQRMRWNGDLNGDEVSRNIGP